MNIRLTHIGTATLLLEIGSLRLLTDPVFDPAGGQYFFGYGTNSTKLTAPSIKPEDLGRIDAVLLSHDHHEDNLDHAGRALLPLAKKVITTVAGANRLKGNAIGLRTWQSTTLKSQDTEIKITATPSQHGTWGSHLIVGETTGFILEWAGQQHGALYISGDRSGSTDCVRSVNASRSVLPFSTSAARVSPLWDRSDLHSTLKKL